MAEENISLAPIIDIFKDDMYCWILNPNSTPNTNRFLLSKFIQEQRITFAVDTGVADAYVIALKSTLTSYIAGQQFTFQATNANTGASTINIDSISVKTIKRTDGTDLQVGDIPANSINIIQYDGVNFQLLTSIGEAAAWISSLTTGDVTAIQNTVISDISGQTGTKTFDGIKWDITTTGRTSTGEVNFLNFLKDSSEVFKVDIDGAVSYNVNVSGIGSNSASILNETSTATNPTVIHNKADLITGIGGIAGEWSAIVGGIEAINIDASQFVTIGSKLGVGIAPTSTLHIGGGTGGVNSGINLELEVNNVSLVSSYIPMDFNTPSGLTGQFLATASNYANAAVNLDVSSVGLLSHIGNISMLAGGVNGEFIVTTGGLGPSKEALRITSTKEVGIGTNSPDATAILDVSSTTKGVRFSNMTTTQRDALTTPPKSLIQFNITTNQYEFNSGTSGAPIWTAMLGDITKIGTPVNNELGVWTGDGTLEGESNLTYDGIRLILNNATTPIYRLSVASTAIADIKATTGGLITDVLSSSDKYIWRVAGNQRMDLTDVTLTIGAFISVGDGFNLQFGTSTGTIVASTSSSKMGFWGTTPIIQPAHILDADGTLADITTKFNTLLAQMASTGLQAST